MRISEEIINKIKSLPSPAIIAISGFGGAGKTTFTKILADALDVSVFSIDSFQKRGVFDTNYRLWEVMDFLRLEREVIKPFLKKDQGKILIEGVGLFRPELLKYFTYKIWIECPLETAITRGKKRDREINQNPMDELWDGIWKDNDLQYIEEFNPKSVADLIINNE